MLMIATSQTCDEISVLGDFDGGQVLETTPSLRVSFSRRNARSITPDL